jgi:hypothetical protein
MTRSRSFRCSAAGFLRVTARAELVVAVAVAPGSRFSKANAVGEALIVFAVIVMAVVFIRRRRSRARRRTQHPRAPAPAGDQDNYYAAIGINTIGGLNPWTNNPTSPADPTPGRPTTQAAGCGPSAAPPRPGGNRRPRSTTILAGRPGLRQGGDRRVAGRPPIGDPRAHRRPNPLTGRPAGHRRPPAQQARRVRRVTRTYTVSCRSWSPTPRSGGRRPRTSRPALSTFPLTPGRMPPNWPTPPGGRPRTLGARTRSSWPSRFSRRLTIRPRRHSQPPSDRPLT